MPLRRRRAAEWPAAGQISRRSPAAAQPGAGQQPRGALLASLTLAPRCAVRNLLLAGKVPGTIDVFFRELVGAGRRMRAGRPGGELLPAVAETSRKAWLPVAVCHLTSPSACAPFVLPPGAPQQEGRQGAGLPALPAGWALMLLPLLLLRSLLLLLHCCCAAAAARLLADPKLSACSPASLSCPPSC